MDDARRGAIEEFLRAVSGDAALRITGAALLSGGAIQQNWALDVVLLGAPEAWVLRTDNAATLAVSLPRAAE
ncbi:MAG: phosphotransferase family protein, partial [Rhodospirillales bacterium]|nr:phosphotransferase family protein [Rhodospirillales bacterium]